MTSIAIGEGTCVTLHFSIELENGEIIDSNFEKDPAKFDVGDGSLLPGFERVLFGLCPGEKQTFTLQPQDGFGQPNPNNIQVVERDSFNDIKIEVGLVITFKDASGVEVPGMIASVSDKDVSVDFNHPLAGRVIIFSVHILAVEPSVTH